MHLKSIELKGFKSFPDRTQLKFGEGVSVVVGPNGSGKSNITDAVLWCLGEQSPLAVRGQSMQDVIFSGGRGMQARQEAVVELVLDNSDGAVDLPVSELSIVRRLNRAGEGEYRLNGARCRLVDVLEVLSDTGLGKEAHSVISQGRVEGIVTSKPRDRRMLIEEAAGLGKHRKRRRRAQLKLERTQENLDRALDVEREARARLRPLKRQAEAADLHERLERQALEARWELARDALRSSSAALSLAEQAAAAAREQQAGAERALEAVAQRREAAEEALAARSAVREQLSQRVFGARSSLERIALRQESAQRLASSLETGAERRRRELGELEQAAAGEGPERSDRLEALEAELAQLEKQRESRLERELAELAKNADLAKHAVAAAEQVRLECAAELDAAEEAAQGARSRRRAAEQRQEGAQRERARIGGELAAVNQFLRSASAARGPSRLEEQLQVAPGLELALAAALGELLQAGLADDLPAAERLLDELGKDGGRVLVLGGGDGPQGAPPAPGAELLLSHVQAEPAAQAHVARLLADTWVLDRLDLVPGDFRGLVVTRQGRVWSPALGELRQHAAGGHERALEQRNRRQELIKQTEAAATAGLQAQHELAEAAAELEQLQRAVELREQAARQAGRSLAEAQEAARRSLWLIDQRRTAPEQGESAVARAQLTGELAAERRAAAERERERERREQRIELLRGQLERHSSLLPAAAALQEVLSAVHGAVELRLALATEALQADALAGAGVADALRACAAEEAELQLALRAHSQQVTSAEVQAQQARDGARDAQAELTQIAERLGLEAAPADEALGEPERTALAERLERIARRREQLGPVNPLAGEEYREALERVEELETQREDLETALRELRSLIRDTDRQISDTFEQTFAAAAKNFEQLAQDVFPGGRGRLRLVREDSGPRAVLGGQDQNGPPTEGAEAEAEAEEAAVPEDEQLGVEIEITPAGKSMKRLSLLSGGEKSMTALAFMFAVFLARPCPFYILDEVEAALDDLNIDRFLALLRRHSERAQFIVVTHQKRTMEAADVLYGVSMGGDGVSKIVSRRLDAEAVAAGDEPLAGVA